MSSADLHTATGAYVLHALSPAERDRFDGHLAECAACAQEVEELSATAQRLGVAVAATPPAHVKERVLRQITTVRQEPPRLPVRDRARSWTKAAPRFALAACLAAAVGLGGVAVWQHRSAEDARQQAQRAEQQAADLTAVLAAPDARTVTGRLGDGATGTVVVSKSRNQAAFLASSLPELPGGKVYQLWFDDGGGTMRAAGLVPEPGATAAVLMEGHVDDASGMGVTVEPAGGSPQPTTQPIGLMSFPT